MAAGNAAADASAERAQQMQEAAIAARQQFAKVASLLLRYTVLVCKHFRS